MREFFRGWRRKLGCLTLVMALVLMVGWMRSRVVHDAMAFQISKHIAYTIVSHNGTLDLGRRIDAEQLPDMLFIKWFRLPRPANGQVIAQLPPRKWRWQAAGFGVSDRTLPQQDFTYWTVPYWFPTGILTILSAWLLLAKPRPRPQPNPGT